MKHLKLPGRRSSCLFEGPRVQDLSSFFDRVSRIHRKVLENVALSAGPLDFDLFGGRLGTHTKGECKFRLRTVTRAGMNNFGHNACRSLYAHHSTYTTAIGSAADGFDSQAIVGDAGILKQIGRTAIGGHEDVERAIIVNVCICRARRRGE